MAASMGNRRKPENSKVEQQEQQTGLRRRPRRIQQQQPLGQEVTRIPFPPPQRRLRRAILRSYPPVLASMRPSSELPKPLPPRQSRQKTALFARSPVQPLRPVSEINPQRPSTTANGVTPLQNFGTQESRTQQLGYRREEKASVSSPRINPWQVNPKSTSPHSSLSSVGSQNPQSLDTSRRGKERERIETPTSQPFQPLTNSSKRRLENNPSQSAAKVAATPTQAGNASGRGVRQKASPQTSQSPTKPIARRLKKRPLNPLVYIMRLLILGIGIGAIVGTLLSALDPATHASVKGNDTAQSQVQESPSPQSRVTPLALSQEIFPLKAQVQALAAKNPKLQPGIFIFDLDTGAYIDSNSQYTFPAASTIKLPILVALFQEVDAGKIRLDESLILQPEMMATGSGDLQYQKPGTKYTVLELATKMIAISDNTATNMLIARLGGVEALNKRFHSWGLTATVVHNPLPDLEGTNLTSPQELANLMSIVNQGQMVSLASRDRILDIMQHNEIDNLLPKGLGAGAVIAHKTGNIGSMLADVGLVDMPTGKRYIIAVMVKRPFNDPSAQELIRQISQTAYEYFNQPRVSLSTSSMPSGNMSRQGGAIALDNYNN